MCIRGQMGIMKTSRVDASRFFSGFLVSMNSGITTGIETDIASTTETKNMNSDITIKFEIYNMSLTEHKRAYKYWSKVFEQTHWFLWVKDY